MRYELWFCDSPGIGVEKSAFQTTDFGPLKDLRSHGRVYGNDVRLLDRVEVGFIMVLVF